MNNYSLLIVKTIVVFLIYMCSNFTKTLISIISYLIAKFLLYITNKSIKQVEYESTLTGGIVTYISNLNNKYGAIVKCVLHFSYSVPLLFLRIFSRYFSSSPIIFFHTINFSSGLGLIVSVFSVSYAVIKMFIEFNLKNLLLQYFNTNEFKQFCKLIEISNIIYM